MSKQKILLIVCVFIFFSGLAGSVLVLLTPRGTQVNIVQDGTVLYTIDLTTAQDQTLEIEYKGRTNIVQIENGRIHMLEAECPDQICVHMGWLDSGFMPIVCLPNHLSIEYAGSGDDIDAVIR